jgi:hypothetical protein
LGCCCRLLVVAFGEVFGEVKGGGYVSLGSELLVGKGQEVGYAPCFEGASNPGVFIAYGVGEGCRFEGIFACFFDDVEGSHNTKKTAFIASVIIGHLAHALMTYEEG